MPPLIVVVGSLNIDLIAEVYHLPSPGESVGAKRLLERFGGKGANQALAASRLGARVAMIGCVGCDLHGRKYLERFALSGIDTDGIASTPRQPTGTALIAVDERGENQIIAYPGANFALTPTMIRRHRSKIAAAAAHLVQLEVPLPAALESMRSARRANVPIIFNPSPWRPEFPWGEIPLDFVIVNEREAESLLGHVPANATARTASKAQAAIGERAVRALIVTRGARSTLCFSASFTGEVPPLRVKPVDTVGAGDAFAGAFCAALARGFPLEAVIRRANCAGALATLKRGAQEGLPTERQVAAAVGKG